MSSQKRPLSPPLDASAQDVIVIDDAGDSELGSASGNHGPEVGKRARLDPLRMLCRFELLGECTDPACPDQHLSDLQGTRPVNPQP